MRKIVLAIVVAFFCVVAWYGYLVWQNNHDLPPPTQSEIEKSLNAGIEWLVRNEDSILDNNNPMLWWMVQRSAEITGDVRLKELFRKYGKRYLVGNNHNYWRPLFIENTWIPIRYQDIKALPYYNQHFLYALTCDADLGRQPEIGAQNRSEFCFRNHPVSPACLTHQLMGLRLMQIHGCGNQEQLERTIGEIQQKIRRQLTLDIRVVDVYLQRVLMLVESGARDVVKPVWIRHALSAQRKDGGWSGFDPVIRLLNGYHFGFDARGVSVFTGPQSNFHATAQGVLLVSLLDTMFLERVD